MSHCQTEPISPLDPSLTNKIKSTNIIPQNLERGWTKYLLRFGEESIMKHQLTRFQVLSNYTRDYLEKIMIRQAASSPGIMQQLIGHVEDTDNINSGRILGWLSCDMTIAKDCGYTRKTYIDLYNEVLYFGGEIFRTTKGPRITIPSHAFENWDKYTSEDKESFAWIVFMHMHQFNRRVWEDALEIREYDLWSYYLDLCWETGAYKNINNIVYNEFRRKENHLLTNDFNSPFLNSDDKPNILLPSTGTTLYWSKELKGWYKAKDAFDWGDFVNYPPDSSGEKEEFCDEKYHPTLWETGKGKSEWNKEDNGFSWKSLAPSKTTSAWGSPSHSVTNIDENSTPMTIARGGTFYDKEGMASSSSPPHLTPPDSDISLSDSEDYSVASITDDEDDKKVNSVMYQSQFLSSLD